MEKNDLIAWMKQSADLVGIVLPPESEAGVLENLERNFAIASVLVEMELTDLDEPAAIFSP